MVSKHIKLVQCFHINFIAQACWLNSNLQFSPNRWADMDPLEADDALLVGTKSRRNRGPKKKPKQTKDANGWSSEADKATNGGGAKNDKVANEWRVVADNADKDVGAVDVDFQALVLQEFDKKGIVATPAQIAAMYHSCLEWQESKLSRT